MFWTILVSIVAAYFLFDRIIRLFKVGGYSSKHVFITGCDSGFGRELAIRLDKMGFPVFAACLTEDGRRQLAEICSSRLVTLPLNVANSENILEAFKTVTQKLPDDKSLWAVVNNAGVPGQSVPIEMLPLEEYKSTCSINLFGAMEVSRVFLPLLRKSQGHLVLMTSVMGRCPATPAPYAVSKFGLEAFGDVCRREVSRFGVKVSMIEPGYFRTNIIGAERILNDARRVYGKSDKEVQTAYGTNLLQEMENIMPGLFEFSSPDTYKVVDAYVDAITCTYPRPRYVVGNDAKFIFVPLSFMPEYFVDWLLARQRKKLLEKSQTGR